MGWSILCTMRNAGIIEVDLAESRSRSALLFRGASRGHLVFVVDRNNLERIFPGIGLRVFYGSRNNPTPPNDASANHKALVISPHIGIFGCLDGANDGWSEKLWILAQELLPGA